MHGQPGAGRGGLDGGGQPTLGQDARVDLARELAQLVIERERVGDGLVQKRAQLALRPPAGDPQPQGEREHVLLEPIVEAVLQPLALGVGRLHQPSRRRRRLFGGRGALHRQPGQLRQIGDPILVARGQRLRALRGDGQRAPQPPADPHRGRDGRAQPDRAHGDRQLAPAVLVAIGPGRPAGHPHASDGAVAAVEVQLGVDGEAPAAAGPPLAHDHRPLLADEAQQHARLRAEPPGGLAGDGGEDLLQRGIARHQQRHPQQPHRLPDHRGLLFGVPDRHAVSVPAPALAGNDVRCRR